MAYIGFVESILVDIAPLFRRVALEIHWLVLSCWKTERRERLVRYDVLLIGSKSTGLLSQ